MYSIESIARGILVEFMPPKLLMSTSVSIHTNIAYFYLPTQALFILDYDLIIINNMHINKLFYFWKKFAGGAKIKKLEKQFFPVIYILC
jgi:hypothetical protein